MKAIAKTGDRPRTKKKPSAKPTPTEPVYIAPVLGFIAGFVTYLALSKCTTTLPDLMIYLISGALVGWTIGKNPFVAGIVGFTATLTALFLFQTPAFSTVIGSQTGVQTMSASSYSFVFSILSGSFAAAVSFVSGLVDQRLIAYTLLALVTLSYFFSNSALVRPPYNELYEKTAVEPAPQSYAFDGVIYMKTYYLMKRGETYYPALTQAMLGDTRFKALPSSVFSWRMPTVFKLWQYSTTNGAMVLNLYIVFGAISMIAAFLFCSRFVKPSIAMLSPVLLFPYLIYGGVSWLFTFGEYWASFFAIFSLALFAYRQSIQRFGEWASAATALMAALIREHLLYLPFAGLVSAIAVRKFRKSYIWLGAIAIFLAFYLYHYFQVKPNIPPGAGFNVSAWLRGGTSYVDETMRFGLDLFADGGLFRFLALPLALAGCWLIKDREAGLYAFVAICTPVIVFLLIGYPNYWGVTYMPLVLTVSPLGLQVVERLPALVKGRLHG